MSVHDLLQHLASAGEITKQGKWVYEDLNHLTFYRLTNCSKLLRALLPMFLFGAVDWGRMEKQLERLVTGTSLCPGMGEGRYWWSWLKSVIAEEIPRVCHCAYIATPVSLGYPLSVFNKNSTLKQINFALDLCWWRLWKSGLARSTVSEWVRSWYVTRQTLVCLANTNWTFSIRRMYLFYIFKSPNLTYLRHCTHVHFSNRLLLFLRVALMLHAALWSAATGFRSVLVENSERQVSLVPCLRMSEITVRHTADMRSKYKLKIFIPQNATNKHTCKLLCGQWAFSSFLMSWSVICWQYCCFMVRQRCIAEEYFSHNLDEHCL